MKKNMTDTDPTNEFIDDVIFGYYDRPVIDNTVVAYGEGFVIIEDENGNQYTLEADDPSNDFPIGTTVDANTLSIAKPID